MPDIQPRNAGPRDAGQQGAGEPSAQTLSPIALFLYRRDEALPDKLANWRRMRGFAEAPKYIHIDGAKTDADRTSVASVRKQIEDADLPNTQIIARTRNYGARRNIVTGVTDVLRKHDRVIVMEDDLHFGPATLDWFNAGLRAYADTPRVMHIAAQMYDVPRIAKKGRAVFFYHPTVSGWATWRRAWSHYDDQAPAARAFLESRAGRRHFEVGGAMRYSQMLRQADASESDAWDIYWHAAVIAANGLTLNPPIGYVRNEGPRIGKATHGQRTAWLLPPLSFTTSMDLPDLPPELDVDRWALGAWMRRLRVGPYGLATSILRTWSRLRCIGRGFLAG